MRIDQAVSLVLFLFLWTVSCSFGQEKKPTFETNFYGSARVYTGYNFQSQDPDWKDMLRPSKLLDNNGQPYGEEGNYYLSIRPSQLGLNVYQNLEDQEQIHYNFELDFMGSGSFTGQTFFRLRRLYAQWKWLTIGQHNSLFMDADIIPNTVDYFGPNGIIVIRNIQLSAQPISTENHELALGLENPSATSDLGPYDREFIYGDHLKGVDFVTKLPAFTGHYKYRGDWGHVQAAWCAKNISWYDKLADSSSDLSGSEWGYGYNLTSRVSILPDKVDLMGSYSSGRGVQNFTNDGASDIGVKRNFGNQQLPIYGKVIPFYMYEAFAEVQWNDELSSTAGYSYFDNKTFDTQLNTSFKSGAYATANVIYQPNANVTMGVEYQYANRQNADFGGDSEFQLAPEQGAFYEINKVELMINYHFATKRK